MAQSRITDPWTEIDRLRLLVQKVQLDYQRMEMRVGAAEKGEEIALWQLAQLQKRFDGLDDGQK